MKSFLLAAKIAGLFMLVLWTFVVVTLHLFGRTVMRDGAQSHHDFMVTVLQFGLVAMLLIVVLSIYVTAPLRRMSRSMDRIASGDLDHRVKVRGNDEGAAMGRSFNAMAERVRGMIVGQKELMAGVSHELRSPLTRMKLSLELLRQGKGGVERISDLEADVDELDSLVEELLLSSRIDLGAVPLAFEEIDLDDLCQQAWARVADAAKAQGTELQTRHADDARRVMVDRLLAVRLFGNLFENSVRYAGAGTITVSARREGDRIVIEVADEGAAVEESDLDRLFEPFFRPDRSRSRKTGAGGLGLMIVRRAVEAHDGTVRARRAEPRGLTISFDLPTAGE